MEGGVEGESGGRGSRGRVKRRAVERGRGGRSGEGKGEGRADRGGGVERWRLLMPNYSCLDAYF